MSYTIIMARELYDHEKDPAENVNVEAEPDYKQEVQRLSQMLKQGWRAVASEFRI